MNKSIMTRLKILDNLLSNRYHYYSISDMVEEINKKMEDIDPNTNGVGIRTVEKDINYLEKVSPFNVVIERYTTECYNGETGKTFNKRCLRYKDQSFSIFKKEMTEDEKILLNETIKLLGQFDGLPNLQTLESMRLGLDCPPNKKPIISFNKNPLGGSNLLGKLYTAISHKQTIALHYHTFAETNNVKIVNLFPYLLKEYNQRWYLIAAAESTSKLLTFPLDRMNDIDDLPTHKYKDYDGDINKRFEDIIGITLIDDAKLYDILFWANDKSKYYISTKPLHESQVIFNDATQNELHKKYPQLNGGCFYQITCKENYELIRELTLFGNGLVVLSPADIKDKVIKRIKEMLDEYDKI